MSGVSKNPLVQASLRRPVAIAGHPMVTLHVASDGADGILIHSKASTGDEVLAFAREWAGREGATPP